MKKNFSIRNLALPCVIFYMIFSVILFVAADSAHSKKIKIGGITPLTGWAAEEGSYIQNGAKIAIDRINKAGGIKGNKLELILEDGKADPTDSLNAAHKLIIRDKVSAMFGAWLSTPTLAIIPIVEKNQIPLVVETSSHDAITHPVKKWVFRTSFLFSQEAEKFTPCINKLGFEKTAFILHDNDWGRGTYDVFSKALKAQNAKIVSTDYVDPTNMDFYPLLTKIKNTDATGIIVANTTGPVSKMLEQRRELGMTQKLLTTGGSCWPYTVNRLAGDASEGSYHMGFFPAFDPNATPNPEEAEAFISEWKNRGLPWDGAQEGSRGFEVVYTIAKAIDLAGGSGDRAKIREALLKLDYQGITGHIKFNEFHDQNPALYVYEIKGGKSVIANCQ